MSPPWTHAEEEALRILGPQIGGPACAEALGRSVEAVRMRAKRLGVSLRRRRTYDPILTRSRSEAVLRRIRELTEAELCPACGKRLIGVKRTGLCGRCHFEGLRRGARGGDRPGSTGSASSGPRARSSVAGAASWRRWAGSRATRKADDKTLDRHASKQGGTMRAKQRQSVAARATSGAPNPRAAAARGDGRGQHPPVAGRARFADLGAKRGSRLARVDRAPR